MTSHFFPDRRSFWFGIFHDVWHQDLCSPSLPQSVSNEPLPLLARWGCWRVVHSMGKCDFLKRWQKSRSIPWSLLLKGMSCGSKLSRQRARILRDEQLQAVLPRRRWLLAAARTFFVVVEDSDMHGSIKGGGVGVVRCKVSRKGHSQSRSRTRVRSDTSTSGSSSEEAKYWRRQWRCAPCRLVFPEPLLLLTS